jgi:DNA repair exonuclease SbcCD ATPase subunit
MMKDKRTKADLLECISYLNNKITVLSTINDNLEVTNINLESKLKQSLERNSNLEKEVSRCNDLIHATTSENNRLTIERNAANALVDRIRIPSDMQISPRSMQQLLDNLNSEIVSALLLVKG